MIRHLIWATAICLTITSTALPCPNCKEAVAASGDTDSDPYREARAYNSSIYFMLAVPYTLLGVGSFVGYRMYRSSQQRQPVRAGG